MIALVLLGGVFVGLFGDMAAATGLILFDVLEVFQPIRDFINEVLSGFGIS